MHALKRDWGTMHLHHKGGTGPALVFINSLGTDLRMWDEVCGHLPPSWVTLRMDKRGHGLSETAPEGYGIPELAEDVIAAMDEAGPANAILIGCSIGGLIAQHVALMAPERVTGLVLSNTAPKLGPADGWHARIAAIRETGMAAMAGGVLPRWFGPKMLANPNAALWRTLLARTDQEGYIATCAAIAGTDISDRLPEITQPALVLAGKHDLATPPEVVEALARALPRADLVMFEDTGHLPAIEAPEAFTEAVMKFVERIAA
ncbi:3-oxoadipate enol-lactonase [Celeribacter neptunius]|uniref:3-oxoadipate enol-lactonase n=1 Tax=Celeribacter neptunius TaxID=588602 RepID=A0A1I3WD40_9RHOB|nr:3-oxoadipate enol-lactonase [Celeribacter neptunius]SFK05425.1 3-oxoadipate enol-lactonase [Celeribacter neptunius]